MGEDNEGNATLSRRRRCGNGRTCDPENARWGAKVRWSSRASGELQGGGCAVLDDLRVQEAVLGGAKAAEGARGDGAGGRPDTVLEGPAVVVTPEGGL